MPAAASACQDPARANLGAGTPRRKTFETPVPGTGNGQGMMLRADRDRLVPATILGQDDWMIVGRTVGGTLVYTVVEMDGRWLDAPHRGDCWDPATGRNCDGETKQACRLDCQFMQDHVAARPGDYDWEEFGDDPVSGEYLGWDPGEDAEFTARSSRNYLPLPHRSRLPEEQS